MAFGAAVRSLSAAALRTSWADVQDSSQDLIENSQDSRPPLLSQASQEDSLPQFGPTPDDFELDASQVRRDLEQCVIGPRCRDVPEEQVNAANQSTYQERLLSCLFDDGSDGVEADSSQHVAEGTHTQALPNEHLESMPAFGSTPDSFDEWPSNSFHAPRDSSRTPDSIDGSVRSIYGIGASYRNAAQLFGSRLESFGKGPSSSCPTRQESVQGNVPAFDNLQCQSPWLYSAPADSSVKWQPAALHEAVAGRAMAISSTSASASTPMRRSRTKKRSSQQLANTPNKRRVPTDVSSSNLSSTTKGASDVKASMMTMYEEDAEDDDHQEQQFPKRHNAVAYVKTTAAYRAVTQLRLNGIIPDSDAPKTPDPTDTRTSKRFWEKKIQNWRNELDRCASQVRQ